MGTSGPAIRRFLLFDGHGGYAYSEDIPADIAPLDGTGVLVLLPPDGIIGMGVGRVVQHMTPTPGLDRVLNRGTGSTGWHPSSRTI